MIGSRFWSIYLIFFLSFSCVEKTNNDEKYKIYLSEKISFLLKEPILVPQYPFPSHQIFETKDSIVIFNSFKFGLNVLDYQNNTLRPSHFQPIDQIKNNFLESPDYIIRHNGETIFLQNQLLIRFNDSLEFISNTDLTSLNPINEWDIPYFKTSNNFEFGSTFNALDPINNKIYFFSKDLNGDQIELFSYDLNREILEVIDASYDKSIILDQEIKFNDKTIFTVDNLPFILFKNGVLIFTYYGNSKIDIYDLNTKKSISKKNKNILFLSERKLIPVFPRGISAFEASQYTVEWESEVAFGQLRFWPKCDCYYRMVKGSSRKEIQNFDVFIEFFDQEFDKIQETNLSKINSDLGTFTIPFKEEILIKARNQSSEDDYFFYSLKIDF